MKILFITRKWPPAVGGMETYCMELVRELERDCDVRLHALPGKPEGGAPGAGSLIAFGLATAWRVLGHGEKFDVVHGGDMAVWPLVWRVLENKGYLPRWLQSFPDPEGRRA